MKNNCPIQIKMNNMNDKLCLKVNAKINVSNGIMSMKYAAIYYTDLEQTVTFRNPYFLVSSYHVLRVT